MSESVFKKKLKHIQPISISTARCRRNLLWGRERHHQSNVTETEESKARVEQHRWWMCSLSESCCLCLTASQNLVSSPFPHASWRVGMGWRFGLGAIPQILRSLMRSEWQHDSAFLNLIEMPLWDSNHSLDRLALDAFFIHWHHWLEVPHDVCTPVPRDIAMLWHGWKESNRLWNLWNLWATHDTYVLAISCCGLACSGLQTSQRNHREEKSGMKVTLPETASFNEVEGGIWRPRIADCSNMFECSSEFPLMKLTRCPVRYCSVEGICKLQIGSMVQHLCELAAAMAMGASRTGLRRLTGLPHSNMVAEDRQTHSVYDARWYAVTICHMFRHN